MEDEEKEEKEDNEVLKGEAGGGGKDAGGSTASFDAWGCGGGYSCDKGEGRAIGAGTSGLSQHREPRSQAAQLDDASARQYVLPQPSVRWVRPVPNE